METYALTGIAFELHQELNEPSDPSQSKIGLWLEFNAGSLNNKLSKNYQIVSGDYSPSLEIDEKGIAKSLYYVDYYTNLSRDIFVRSSQGGNIVSIRDDQSSVTFERSKDASVEIYKIAQDMNKRSNDLINSYKHNRSGPRDSRENIDGYKY